MLLHKPLQQSEEGVCCGAELSDLLRDVPSRINLAQTRCQLRLMYVDPTTDRLDHLHSRCLLSTPGSTHETPGLRLIMTLFPRVLQQAD